MVPRSMAGTLMLNLGTLAAEVEEWCELEIEVDYHVEPGDPGDRVTPPTGVQVDVLHAWLGTKRHWLDGKYGKVDILPALDSLDIGLEDKILESLSELEEDIHDGPDEDA